LSLANVVATTRVSKLEDVKLENAAVDSELDQFFSSKPLLHSDEKARGDDEKEENAITYLEDEVPDFM
jgi:hypothetical protein